VQLTVTVADGVTHTRSDLLVDLDDAATVADLSLRLVQTVRPDVPLLTALRSTGRTTGPEPAPRPARLFVDGRPLDPATRVVDSPVRTGSLIGLDDGALSTRPEPQGAVDLRVVGGPGAGRVARLTVGRTEVGSGSGCAVVLDLPGVPVAAFELAVEVDGTCTLTPAEGVLLRLGDVEVVEAVPWPDGAYVRLGDLLLEVRRATRPDAALIPSEDGAGLDFNRPPRLLPPVPRTVFTLPSEPDAPRRRTLPVLAVLAPLLMAAVMVLVLGSLRYAIFGLMSPVLAIGNHFSSRSGAAKQHRDDMARFVERTEKVTADAHEALRAERAVRRDSAPDPAELLLFASGPRARLWERRRDDPDYLALRVGTADLPSAVLLTDPAEPEHRREVTWQVPDAPVTVSLPERGVLGLAGRGDLVRPLAAWLVAQVAVLQSPRDVQVVVLTDASSADTWDWLRWLPHCRPGPGQDGVVLLGNDADSVARRVGELQAVLAARAGGGADGTRTDVVVVLDGARRLRALPGVVQLLKEGPAAGIHAVCLDAEERLLPEECTAVVVQTGPATVTVRQQRADVVSDARVDLVPASWFPQVARALAPVRDVTDDGGEGALPAGCRLLDVLGLEPPTPAGIGAIWARGGRTTEAVVGLSLDGPFALDLRRDGPHALVAGTTGAGKSELLQTLVASLAIANRPDAMTFVLIDYKGGSAFKDCVRLPHTVGMVTDLDTHLVERALVSLGAELHRREHLLATLGAKDIEDYTDLVDSRGGDPLPRLLLVIDEFASMARELPDFVAGLVNVAQRGRSLGIHLLLATQRPSGVVSPEIRANTNLRIALRVTDKAESTDVVDSPDAALIGKSTPGRAYVRLGHSALVPFQAGRVGGRRPGAVAAGVLPPWSAPLGWARLGYPPPARPRTAEPETDAAETDLGALVAAVCAASEHLGMAQQHSPWLPALPDLLRLPDLPPAGAGEGDLPAVPWALSDLPASQARRPEVIDLATLGHKYVIGSARSGRTQTLRTIAGALAAGVSSADVHLYGLDCGNGGLLALTALPHCGAVVLRTQTDRAARLLGRLVQELVRRQEVLAASGFANVTEQRAAASATDALPHLVLFVDRWEGFAAALAELDNGSMQVAMTTLLGEGASAGVHCVLSGDRSLTSYRMSSMTEDKIVLRLSDRGDYTAAGLSVRALPEVFPDGRGFQPDGTVETQVAVLDGPLTGQGQAEALAVIGAEAAVRDAGVPRVRRPFRIDVLPAQLSYAEACSSLTGERPPLWGLLGVGGDDLDAYGPDLGRTPVFLIAGPPRSGRSTALLTVVTSLLERSVPVVVLAPRVSPLRELPVGGCLRAVLTTDVLTEDELAPLLAVEGPLVLVIDDGELHKDAPAGELLKSFLRTAGDLGRGLVVAGESTALAAGYSGWHAEARKARAGALLCPQASSDGELIGVRLPRSSVGEPVRPGRALLHLGDGSPLAVAVPQTTPLPG
jgi:S-DNA-T family DNA segregation ATPase FtsK/SpoIIIE